MLLLTIVAVKLIQKGHSFMHPFVYTYYLIVIIVFIDLVSVMSTKLCYSKDFPPTVQPYPGLTPLNV